DRLSAVEFDRAVGEIEITIVVCDDEYGLAVRLQAWQQTTVEHVFEHGILIGGPFVEYVERPVLQAGDQKREALPLSLREIESRESAVHDTDLVIQLQLDEQRLCG